MAAKAKKNSKKTAARCEFTAFLIRAAKYEKAISLAHHHSDMAECMYHLLANGLIR